MLGWLWRMLFGRFKTPFPCKHRWHIKDTIDVFGLDVIGKVRKDAPIYRKYVLQCSRCGDIKIKSTMKEF